MKRKIIIGSFFIFLLALFSSGKSIKLFKVETTYILPSSTMKSEKIVWDFVRVNYDLGKNIYTFKIFPESTYKTVYGFMEVSKDGEKLFKITIYKKVGGKMRKYERYFPGGCNFFIDSFGGIPIFVLPHMELEKSNKGFLRISKVKRVDEKNRFLMKYKLKKVGKSILICDENHKRELGLFKYGNFFWWKESKIYNMNSRLVYVEYEK